MHEERRRLQVQINPLCEFTLQNYQKLEYVHIVIILYLYRFALSGFKSVNCTSVKRKNIDLFAFSETWGHKCIFKKSRLVI